MGRNKAGPGVTQRRVLRLALRGKNVSQTARELKISRAAVYFHLNALRDAGSLPGARNGNEEGAA